MKTGRDVEASEGQEGRGGEETTADGSMPDN